MSEVLSCCGVSSGYGSSEVISNLDFTISEGDICALVGKNGAGKTTLLNTVLGLVAVRRGAVQLFGSDISHWPPYRITTQDLSCAPQDNALFSDLSVGVNLRMGGLRLSKREYRQGLEFVVDMFPFIAQRLAQKAGTLSGGEQGMLKLARALITRPSFILLDEITEGLNPAMVSKVGSILRKEREANGTTVWIIEQNVNFVAEVATRYALMKRGSIMWQSAYSGPKDYARIAEHLTI